LVESIPFDHSIGLFLPSGGKDIFVPVCLLPHLSSLQSGTYIDIVNTSFLFSLVHMNMVSDTILLSFLFNFVTGSADAFVRLLPGIDCAVGAFCHERRVVFEDFERGEENTVEMVMSNYALDITLDGPWCSCSAAYDLEV
jgi:hypothetical protein